MHGSVVSRLMLWGRAYPNLILSGVYLLLNEVHVSRIMGLKPFSEAVTPARERLVAQYRPTVALPAM